MGIDMTALLGCDRFGRWAHAEGRQDNVRYAGTVETKRAVKPRLNQEAYLAHYIYMQGLT